MAWLGLLIGGLVGSGWGFKTTLIGALIGALAGAYLRKSASRSELTRPRGDSVLAGPPESDDLDPVPGLATAMSSSDLAAEHRAIPAPAIVPVRKGGRGVPSAMGGRYAAAGSAQALGGSDPTAQTERVPRAAATSSPLWTWFTGGNALTRIGVVVLFFGVAFLLRYLVDIVTISIELKLLMVGIGGLLLVAIGAGPVRSRAGYGISLQGAGAGVLYLTAFAGFRIYHVLPLIPGLALLVLVTLLTIGLALREDSEPLAALAVAGGFLAPVLSDVGDDPLLLFSYFAVLNAAIFALAWVRSWRLLNLVGFALTFALASIWGYRYYAPRYFATVEPFLVLLFVFYVCIAILYAYRGRLQPRSAIDGVLVFGVPLIGFAQQAALVHGIEYGAAWSAGALAAVYAVLFLLLRRRAEPGLALLARAFVLLAAIFLIVAVPLVFDNRTAAALWAVAAAGVFWLGLRQNAALIRGLALLVQGAAGAVFFLSRIEARDEVLFANAFFVGAVLIALSAFVTSWLADRHQEKLSPAESRVASIAFLWGGAWWLISGVFEFRRHLDGLDASHAALAWVAASSVAAMLLRYRLRWPRVLLFGIALLPTMAIVALRDFRVARTTLDDYGWIVWPLAWAIQWMLLRAADMTGSLGAGAGAGAPADAATATRSPAAPVAALRVAHALSAIGLTAQFAWEASEWVDAIAPSRTVWLACAAILPFIVYLSFTPLFARTSRWPLGSHLAAYTTVAGAPIAVLVGVWFVVATIVSPGTATPLPYIPLLNPLELTLLLALAVLVVWLHRFSRWDEPTIYSWLGVGLFIAVNAMALRTAHHWADIPWRVSSLLASRPLQAGLTLAWTTTGVVLMAIATRAALRSMWMIGAALLAAALGKLFLIDLAALSGLPRVVAFLGVGLLLLAIGYLSPLPPARANASKPGNDPA